MTQPITVIVPIFNGFPQVCGCLESVARNTASNVAVLIVDDASTDLRVRPYLERFVAGFEHFSLIKNGSNLGFVGSVNRAIGVVTGDVILLNSDTEVYPGWIEALTEAAGSDEKVGVVCPLSDNATILSLLSPGLLEQGIPADPEKIASFLATLANDRLTYPIPTAVGFCMYIRRTLIECIGDFDEIFGAGYGEENDFSMRTWRAGFSVICQPCVFVRHFGGVSFDSVPVLASQRPRNVQILDARWPQYKPWIHAFDAVDPRWAFELWLVGHSARIANSPLIAHCVHRWGDTGGVESYAQRLIAHSQPEVVHIVVLPSRSAVRPQVRRCTVTKAWLVDVPARPGTTTPSILDHPILACDGAIYEGYFETILEIVSPDVLHIHHMLDSFTVGQCEIASRVGTSVVWGLHDYFAICPNYSLLKPNLAICRKPEFMSGDTECVRCIGENISAPVHAQKVLLRYDSRRRGVWLRQAAASASLLYAPSRAVVDRLRPAWGDLADRIRVIPHHTYAPVEGNSGRSAAIAYGNPRAASPGKLVIAHLGAFARAKGADKFIALRRLLESDPRFEFWVIGPIAPEFRPAVEKAGIKDIGRYVPARLGELLDDVFIVCCLSNADETFGFTIDEALSHGKTVITTRSRAISERHRDQPSLLFVDFGDYREAGRLVRDAADNRRLRQSEPIAPMPNFQPIFDTYRVFANGAVPTGDQVDDDTLKSADKRLVRQIAALGRACELSRGQKEAPYQTLANEAAGSFGNLGLRDWLRRHYATMDQCLSRLEAQTAVADLVVVDLATVSEVFDDSVVADWVLVKDGRDSVDVTKLLSILANLDASAAHHKSEALILSDLAVAKSGERYGPRFKPVWSHLAYRGAELVDGAVVYRRSALIQANAGSIVEPNIGDFHSRTLDRISARFGESSIAVSEALLAGRDEARAWNLPPSKVPGLPSAGAALPGMAVDIIWLSTERPAPALLVAIVNVLSNSPLFGLLHVVLPADTQSDWIHPKVRIVRRDFDGEQTTGAAIQGIVQAARAELFVLTCLQPNGDLPALVLAASQILTSNVGAVTTVIANPQTGGVVSAGLILGAGPFSLTAPVRSLTGVSGNAAWGRGVGVREVEAGSDGLLIVRAVTLRELNAASVGTISREGLLLEISLRIREAGQRIVCMDITWNPVGAGQASDLQDLSLKTGQHDRQLLLDDGFFSRTAGARVEPIASRYAPAPSIVRSPFFPAWLGSPKTELRVVAAPHDQWGSGYYRVRQPLQYLADKGWIDLEFLPSHNSGFMPTAAQLTWSDVDVVFAHNPFHDYQIAALSDFRRHTRCRIVAGMDDLLDQLPDYNPYSQTQYRDIRRRIAAVNAIVDGWVFSTPRLAEAYAIGFDRCYVIPNALHRPDWTFLDDVTQTVRSNGRLRVGWVGARQHAGDLELLRLAFEETKSSVDWVFMGMLPDFAERAKVEFHQMVPIQDYPSMLNSLDLDVGLAPLLDNPFNRSKSSIKALEYLAVGALPICSDIGVYESLPVRMARPSAEGFLEALRGVVEDDRRKRTAVPPGGWLDEIEEAWLGATRGLSL